MVGGTNVPPQDSEKRALGRMSKNKGNTKKLYEGKSQNPSMLYVSLDIADTVIEGGPPFAVCLLCGG